MSQDSNNIILFMSPFSILVYVFPDAMDKGYANDEP